MKNKLFLLMLILALGLGSRSAEASNPEGLQLKKVTVAELQDIYQKYGYADYLRRVDGTVPRIYLEHFPSDYAKITDPQERDQLFIRIMTPLALKLNEEILAERTRVELFARKLYLNEQMSDKEIAELEVLAEKYDAFTRLQGRKRQEIQVEKLLNKVDQVYPSFLIALAAIETDWGMSRIVNEGNSLYKERVWYSDEGLLPQGEDKDPNYRIKVFPNIYAAMQSFALRLNSDVSFDHTRNMRAVQRRSDMTPSGRNLGHTLLYQSPLNNYTGILDYTITFYKLMLMDQARLEPHIPRPLKKIKTKT